jgi:hypothetical protein
MGVLLVAGTGSYARIWKSLLCTKFFFFLSSQASVTTPVSPQTVTKLYEWNEFAPVGHATYRTVLVLYSEYRIAGRGEVNSESRLMMVVPIWATVLVNERACLGNQVLGRKRGDEICCDSQISTDTSHLSAVRDMRRRRVEVRRGIPGP